MSFSLNFSFCRSDQRLRPESDGEQEEGEEEQQQQEEEEEDWNALTHDSPEDAGLHANTRRPTVALLDSDEEVTPSNTPRKRAAVVIEDDD